MVKANVIKFIPILSNQKNSNIYNRTLTVVKNIVNYNKNFKEKIQITLYNQYLREKQEIKKYQYSIEKNENPISSNEYLKYNNEDTRFKTHGYFYTLAETITALEGDN